MAATSAPVLLVGSAHVIDLAAPLRRVLSSRALNGLAVELDAERAQALFAPPSDSRRGGRGPLLLRLWSILQRRLGEELGSGAGAEMRVAAELAKEWRLPLFLIDDPIRETIARLLGSLSPLERVKLFFGALVGIFLPSRVVKQQIGEYAQEPQEYLDEVRRAYPALARVLLDDRNEHMAERLKRLREQGYVRLAAVVGDAHVPGLKEALDRRGVPVETISLGALSAATAP